MHRIVVFRECSSDLERKSGSDTDESYWLFQVKKGDRCICQRDLISLWIMRNKWPFKKKQRLAAARWLFRTKRMKCGITQRSLNNNKKSYSCRIPAEFMRLEPRFPSRDRGCTRLLLQWVTSAPCSQIRGVSWGKELLLYDDPSLLPHRKEKKNLLQPGAGLKSEVNSLSRIVWFQSRSDQVYIWSEFVGILNDFLRQKSEGIKK